MRISQALKKYTKFVEQFTNQSQTESKIEAEHIFMFVLNVDRPKLYEQFDNTLTTVSYTHLTLPTKRIV